MLSKTSLIILGITKTGDNAIVLHTLSAAHGRKGFIVNVNRKTPMSQFLPLNILEAEVIENPKSKLWRIRNITAMEKNPIFFRWLYNHIHRQPRMNSDTSNFNFFCQR